MSKKNSDNEQKSEQQIIAGKKKETIAIIRGFSKVQRRVSRAGGDAITLNSEFVR